MSGRLEGSIEQHVQQLRASVSILAARVGELEKQVQELKKPVEVKPAEVKHGKEKK